MQFMFGPAGLKPDCLSKAHALHSPSNPAEVLSSHEHKKKKPKNLTSQRSPPSPKGTSLIIKEKEKKEMEASLKQNENVEDDEEYVLLDLDVAYDQFDIPPNTPYVLSGLDTPNPVLVIADKWKLVGEYEETIGTCYAFTETDCTPLVHEETGPSDENLFMGKCIEDPNQATAKQVKPIASLHKILKFRLSPELASETMPEKPS